MTDCSSLSNFSYHCNTLQTPREHIGSLCTTTPPQLCPFPKYSFETDISWVSCCWNKKEKQKEQDGLPEVPSRLQRSREHQDSERERWDEQNPGAPTDQGQDDREAWHYRAPSSTPSLERQLRVLGHGLDQAAVSITEGCQLLCAMTGQQLEFLFAAGNSTRNPCQDEEWGKEQTPEALRAAGDRGSPKLPSLPGQESHWPRHLKGWGSM